MTNPNNTLKASSSGFVFFFSLILLNIEKIVKTLPNNMGPSHLVKTDQAPNVVAIAFPPLNFKKGENACPEIPVSAATAKTFYLC